MGGPWGVCQRCGKKRRLAVLQKEWSGFKVCPECRDTRPASLDPKRFGAEGVPVRGASPEPPMEFIDPLNPVRPEDL